MKGIVTYTSDDWFKPINDFANTKAHEKDCTPDGLYAAVEEFTMKHFADDPDLQLLASKFARDARRSFIAWKEQNNA